MKYVGQNFFWLPVCSGIPVICYITGGGGEEEERKGEGEIARNK